MRPCHRSEEMSGVGPLTAGRRVLASLMAVFALMATSLVGAPLASATVGVWSTPVTLYSPTDGYGGGGGAASQPRVAASLDGSKVVSVYKSRSVRLDGSYDLLRFSRSTDGGVTWSGGTVLSDWGSYTDVPQIASSADGTKIAVAWVAQAYPNYQVKMITSSTSGASWSVATGLSTYGQFAADPQLRMSADGTRIAAVWAQYDGTSYAVQSKTSTNSGATWPSAATVLSASNGSNPQLASSADGTRLTAVWRIASGSNYMIQSKSSADSGSTWTSPATNLIGAEGVATAPQVTASADGLKVTAIWTGNASGKYVVRTRSSTDGGVTWGASIPTLSATGQDATEPRITSSSDGATLSAVWQRSNGTNTIVQTSSSPDAGLTWGAATDLTDTGKNAETPQIVGSSDGTKLTAVWSRPSTYDRKAIQSRASVDSGATWATVVEVSLLTSYSYWDPHIAGSADGAVVAAVWGSNSGTPNMTVVQAAGVSSLTPGLTPTFGTVTRTADGFTVPISNYDAAYGWAVTTSAGVASISGSVVSVSGLAAGASATVTVTSTRSAYSSGSATSTGQALSTQVVTWAPTTAVTVPASPLTPSSSATALGGAVVTYAVTSAGATGCAVDSATGVLTYSSAGSCTVRANAAATSAYAAGIRDVTFTISLATQTVTWAPTTAVTVPSSPLTPSSSATALGGAVVSYAVTSAGSTGCTVDSATGVLTYSAAGSCAVRASATATASYAAGSRDVTFTISNAAAGLTWSPSTALVATSGSVVFAAASAASPGTITYSVTGAGTTGCSVDSGTRTLTFNAAGSCQVTASVAAASGYDAANSVSTFAVTRDTPTLSWAPNTTIYAGASPITISSATTNSTGAVTYAVSADSGAGCAIADATLPVVTVSTAGTCTVTAIVAQTDEYAAFTQSVAFTVLLSTPVMAWSPVLAQSMPSAMINPMPATSDSLGAITYAVTSDSGTSCLVNALTGALSYAGVGQCRVTATTAATPRFATASVSAIFTVSLATQSVTVTSTSTSLAPLGYATLTTSGYSGTGVVTLTLTTGAGVCTLSGVAVLAVADGLCVITAAISADGTYAAASTTISITVTTPAPSSGGSGGSSGGFIASASATTGVRERSLDPIAENAGLAPGMDVVTVDGHVTPVRVEANAESTGLDVIGTGWRVQIVTHAIDGTPRSLEPGGIMAITAGSKLDVSGSGFDGLTQVRIYLMSRSTHLGALMTDKSGDFAGTVIAPTDSTIGPDTLQINGFTPDRSVRSVSLGVHVLSPTRVEFVSIGSRIYFGYKSSALTAKAKRSLMAMIAQVPTGQAVSARVTGALRASGATALDRLLANKRAAVVRGFLKSHGMSGEVTSSVRRVAVRDRYRDRRVEISVRLAN